MNAQSHNAMGSTRVHGDSPKELQPRELCFWIWPMMKLSEEQRQQIVRQLRFGNVTGAMQSCCELTDCDASAAKTLVKELQSEFSCGSASGKTWTLIAGLSVFVAILATVYVYVFPRLDGERVSPTAMIEVRQISMQPQSGWIKMRRIDGKSCYVESAIRMSAVDFSVFRGNGLQVPPTVTLHFSDAGIDRASALRKDRTLTLGVILPNKIVAVTEAGDWAVDRIILPLPGVSGADANEIFARLTN